MCVGRWTAHKCESGKCTAAVVELEDQVLSSHENARVSVAPNNAQQLRQVLASSPHLGGSATLAHGGPRDGADVAGVYGSAKGMGPGLDDVVAAGQGQCRTRARSRVQSRVWPRDGRGDGERKLDLLM